MPRELWKGAIVFGLVNVPVGLYPAEHADELDFTMLDKRDLKPVGYKRYNKSTGAEVPYDKIVKGYEYEKGHYVALDKEDFARANVEGTQEIDIVGFVEASDVAPYYFQSPYYTAPAKHGEKGYALLRETLERTGKAAIANVVIRTRQHLALLYPRGKVLVLNTLRYCDELRPMKDIEAPDSAKAKVNPNEMKMAERLVAEMTMKWEPAQYHDTYHDDLMKLIEEKAKGHVKAAPAHKPARKAEVIDFAKLLEKSLAARKGSSSKPERDGKGAGSDAKPAHARAKRAAPRSPRKPGARHATQRRAA